MQVTTRQLGRVNSKCRKLTQRRRGEKLTQSRLRQGFVGQGRKDAKKYNLRKRRLSLGPRCFRPKRSAEVIGTANLTAQCGIANFPRWCVFLFFPGVLARGFKNSWCHHSNRPFI